MPSSPPPTPSPGGHTPGQHLHAIMVAFFQGGGWAEAPEWGDFDEAGHAVWEDHARIIGRNIRAAAVSYDLLSALILAEDVLARFPFSSEIWPDGTHPNTGIEQIRTAIHKATGSPSPSPLGGK